MTPRSRKLVGLLVGLAALAAVTWWAWHALSEPGTEPAAPSPTRTQPVERAAPDLPEPPAPREPTPAPPPEAPPPSGTLTGRVVDSDRRPVPAATVDVRLGQPLGLQGVLPLERLGRRTAIEERGRFTLADLPARDRVVLRLSGDTFETTDTGPFTIVPDETVDLGDLVVRPGITVFGRISDEIGRAIPDARVEFGYHEQPTTGDDGTALRVVTTDEDGRYEIPHAVRGFFNLVVSADGYGSVVHSGGGPAPVLAGRTRLEVNLRLLRARTIGGRVVTAAGGEPVAGAEVVARAQSGGAAGGRAVTDDSGRFRLEGLSPATYNLGVDANGFLITSRQVSSNALDDEVVIALEPAGSIAGQVVRPDGTPAPHFDLSVRHARNRQGLGTAGEEHRRIADAEGRFRVDDLEPGFYRFEVWARGYAVTISQQIRLRRGQQVEGAVVTLQPSATITGRVVDDLGDPVSGARVSLHPNHQPTVDFLRESDAKAVWLTATHTGRDGRFVLADVTERTYQVQVDHPRHPIVRLDDVEATAGETTELEPFVLVRPATLRGAVLDGNGQPLPNASVSVGGAGILGMSTRTDGRGEYAFTRLPPGRYQVRAVVPRTDVASILAAEIRRVQDGSYDDYVELQPGQELRYNVRVD